MPPVRWKQLVLIGLLVFLQELTSASKLDSAPMSEDGWRPIIGASSPPSYNDEITYYRNPASKKSETIKADKISKLKKAESTTSSTQNVKALHAKPIILVPAHMAHAPQIPLSQMMSTTSAHRLMGKHGKPHHHGGHYGLNKRHKPIRMQIPAYSTRDEVFVPAPSSNLAPYSFYNSNHGAVRTRVGQYPQQQDELYQIVRTPIQQYVLPKHPVQNDVINYYQTTDDFNRNLVPPPPFKYVQDAAPAVKTENNKADGTEVEITREKLNVYHNSIPSNFELNNEEYNPEYKPEFKPDFKQEYKPTFKQTVKPFVKKPDYSNYQQEYKPVYKQDFGQSYQSFQPNLKQNLPTYEVTEGKWSNPYTFEISKPKVEIKEINLPFLPTPLKPEEAPPTVPTESEVSTIYNKVSAINKQKEQTFQNFDIKEVSTHYPILGRPDQQEYPNRFNLGNESDEEEESVEVTTITTTNSPPTRKRPNQRRRRPSTTTPENELNTDFEITTSTTSTTTTTTTTERPQRRRPTRFRSTSTSGPSEAVVEHFNKRHRQRRPKPTAASEEVLDASYEESYVGNYEKKYENFEVNKEEDKVKVKHMGNHRVVYNDATTEIYEQTYRPMIRTTTEKDFPASFVSQFSGSNEEYEDVSSLKPTKENEIEFSTTTMPPVTTTEEPIKEIITEATTTSTTPVITTTTVATTTPIMTSSTSISTTTSTTPVPSTSTIRSHRIRTRPKYDTNRPRFSVKEYRQRLSTTTTTTTEAPSTKTQIDNIKMRFSNRIRRPLPGSTQLNEEATEAIRSKFTPKDPRHTTPETPTTEKSTQSPKVVNNRLRPFGRYKTTEPTTSTPKVSIKPNILYNLRRPTPISLRNRILNKKPPTKSDVEEVTEQVQNDEADVNESNETDMTQIVESTVPYNRFEDSTTEFGAKKTIDVKIDRDVRREQDILKSDDFVQSQIVSDLTSSAKNDYDRPGAFKTVLSSSRKVPNYFTLATDDPILPIEAFFPNLKEKQIR